MGDRELLLGFKSVMCLLFNFGETHLFCGFFFGAALEYTRTQ